MPELITIGNNIEIDFTKNPMSIGCLNHSIYEWINLLSKFFVLLVVGILTIVLPLQQQNLSDRENEHSKTIALNSRLQDIALIHDQQKQQQAVLNTYEQDLCNLTLQYSSIYNSNDTNDDGT
ncbi:unnamed protein product [Rotaria socialis]|uniref:Uncharacterized protein n=1 Tax=Rotaria socialis TaxID=392032 RepID=A0A818V4Q8_9BILA|nr:unnamed protein product [Rotaria socialis]CAF3705838.1 unnamed protein product [Rotaria socialis]CAF4290543.1 unnamed protein product [Rotaria socialis]CAF4471463.1 unnamed protein product [Rotaria socialis]